LRNEKNYYNKKEFEILRCKFNTSNASFEKSNWSQFAAISNEAFENILYKKQKENGTRVIWKTRA